MSLHQALAVSCDTVFYNLAYDIWLKDRRNADTVTSSHAPVQEMQKMELGWGFGKDAGIDLPEESTGTVPTRSWLYYFYQQYKHFWCKNGRANGSYVQRIEFDDCQSGNVWTPGQAVNAAIGQGYVTVTPLQLARAYAALANGGTLYNPPSRRGADRPGRQGRAEDHASGRRPPAGRQDHPRLYQARAGRRDHQGTGATAFGGFPLEQGVQMAGKTGTAQVQGNQSPPRSSPRSPRCDHPKYVAVVMIPNSGFGADVSGPAVRQIWDGLFGLEGHGRPCPAAGAARPAAR